MPKAKPKVPKTEKMFADYWLQDGIDYDPDPNVPWAYKREELARHAFNAAIDASKRNKET